MAPLGLKVATNSGNGANCLILSMLQHASNDYSDEVRSPWMRA